MRIGFGYDVHQLVEGRKLIVGGVEIAHEKGLLGHSDADVLIHAICDALLGAANLGDIGHLFPDNDQTYAGIDSKILLRKVATLLDEKGYRIGNIDCTLCAQRPKIAPFIPVMKTAMATAMMCDESKVSVKATTTEHLGFVGKEEGMSAYAVALIEEK
ncbi:MAG: 2-C-methyl-D-erythritol 2,4-cyclodiphosphate synthase [Bacteroidales bacterium]|nr:2-C-methyl-D-erythritol 2,4-cyclodiphosphate synthase [Bacteroidales bacterium]